MKLVFRRMDKKGRENFEENQRILDVNNHYLIKEFNWQVSIKDNFNKSLQTLRTVILDDQEEIEEKMNVVSKLDKRITQVNLGDDYLTLAY